MTGLVLDASVAVAWIIPDEANETARALFRRALTEPAHTAFHFPSELANAVLTAQRCRRIDEAERLAGLRTVEQLGIRIDQVGPALVHTAVYELAAKRSLSLYDALYLELAIRLDLPLATLDNGLREAAERERVKLA